MSKLIPFQFNGSDLRVISDKDGEPWFIAKDVAEVLGYSDAFEMTKRLDDDEKQNLRIAGFGPRGVTIINESGLYSAILGSSKPEAKPFKRWVTREVLPTIRRTGAYGSQSPVKSIADVAKVFRGLFSVARLVGCDKNAAAIAANNATFKITGNNVLALMDMTHLKASNQESLPFTPTQLGEKVGLTGKVGEKFNQLLAGIGLQERQGKVWVPTDAAKGHYVIELTGKKHGDGTPISQVKWYDSVLEFLKHPGEAA